MTAVHPAAQAYNAAIAECASVAAEVEAAERRLTALYKQFDEVHASLNAAHDAADKAGLFLPRNGITHTGIDRPGSKAAQLLVRDKMRKRLFLGDSCIDRRVGRWDDQEDETTD